jgi:hypothetical protein
MCGVGPERGDPMPDKTLCQEGLGFRVYGLGWDPMPDKTLCEEAGVPEAANSLKAPVSCCTPRVQCHSLSLATVSLSSTPRLSLISARPFRSLCSHVLTSTDILLVQT